MHVSLGFTTWEQFSCNALQEEKVRTEKNDNFQKVLRKAP